MILGGRPLTLPRVTHFHAYAYTGKRYSDPENRSRRVPEGYLPIEIKDAKGPNRRLHSLDEAMAWLKGELTAHEPVDSAEFPLDTRLEYSRATLQQAAGAVVVYGYWTRSGQYVARRVLPCTHCPD